MDVINTKTLIGIMAVALPSFMVAGLCTTYRRMGWEYALADAVMAVSSMILSGILLTKTGKWPIPEDPAADIVMLFFGAVPSFFVIVVFILAVWAVVCIISLLAIKAGTVIDALGTVLKN